MESQSVFPQITTSLVEQDRAIVTSLHETALALGYAAKISPMGKKVDDWKCEYIAAKPKRELYILRVTGRRFSVRAKLYHIAQYTDVLEDCTEHCRPPCWPRPRIAANTAAAARGRCAS